MCIVVLCVCVWSSAAAAVLSNGWSEIYRTHTISLTWTYTNDTRWMEGGNERRQTEWKRQYDLILFKRLYRRGSNSCVFFRSLICAYTISVHVCACVGVCLVAFVCMCVLNIQYEGPHEKQNRLADIHPIPSCEYSRCVKRPASHQQSALCVKYSPAIQRERKRESKGEVGR